MSNCCCNTDDRRIHRAPFCPAFPVLYTGLQMALLARLPKDGAPMTVRSLAAATHTSEYQVTNAFFDLYLAHQVDYDVRSDAYCLPHQAVRGAA